MIIRVVMHQHPRSKKTYKAKISTGMNDAQKVMKEWLGKGHCAWIEETISCHSCGKVYPKSYDRKMRINPTHDRKHVCVDGEGCDSPVTTTGKTYPEGKLG